MDFTGTGKVKKPVPGSDLDHYRHSQKRKQEGSN
jgi:hypothetical protein